MTILPARCLPALSGPRCYGLAKANATGYPKTMKILHVLWTALIFMGMAAQAEARPLIWTGTGVQTQRGTAPSRWRIRLTMDGTGHARIDYPSLQCGGTLVRLHKVGSLEVYREHIHYGRRSCIDGGTVKISRRGNRLVWRWSGEHTTNPATRARATLVLYRHRGR